MALSDWAESCFVILHQICLKRVGISIGKIWIDCWLIWGLSDLLNSELSDGNIFAVFTIWPIIMTYVPYTMTFNANFLLCAFNVSSSCKMECYGIYFTMIQQESLINLQPRDKRKFLSYHGRWGFSLNIETFPYLQRIGLVQSNRHLLSSANKI